jgi:hypothetical protein
MDTLKNVEILNSSYHGHDKSNFVYNLEGLAQFVLLFGPKPTRDQSPPIVTELLANFVKSAQDFASTVY